MLIDKQFINETPKNMTKNQRVTFEAINPGFEDSSSSSTNNNHNNGPTKEEVNIEGLGLKEREGVLSKVFKNKKIMSEDDVNNLLSSFVNRMRFNYTLSLIFEYLTSCLCMRKLSRKRNHNRFKKHYLYQKGKEKLEEELDIVQLIKTMRRFRLLA